MTTSVLIYAFFVAALTLAEWRRAARLQSILKPLAAVGFIVLALQSGALGSSYGIVILAALCFCAIGDVALLSRDKPKLFLLGMTAFGIGHASYVAAFMTQDMSLNGLLGGLALGFSLITMFIIFLWRHITRDMKGAVLAYTVIIMLMMSTASGFAYSANVWAVWLAALMFGVSDFFVARDRFVARANWHPFAITPLYFGAQALFALSTAQAL